MLSTVAVRGYRSLRDLVVPLAQLTVITGANGSGKSSIYRALRLLADCGRGQVIASLAREGGLRSVRWAGAADDGPVELTLGYGADDLGYLIDLGMPVPEYESLFNRDPHIKREAVFAAPTLRPASTLVRRDGPHAARRDDAGRGFTDLSRALPSYRSVLAEFADPTTLPEAAAVRDRLRGWRFYDGFRADADAPARHPQVGTRTFMLADDGADLAAAIQTILEAHRDTDTLHDVVATAFGGARVSVADNDGLFDLQLHQPGLRRPLRAAEFSDGTLRFLLWAAALLSPAPPSLMVLNEPETSLHRDLVAPLAALITAAAAHTQVVVVTHSRRLLDALGAAATRVDLLKDTDGATRIDGQGLLDVPAWHWGSR